MGGERSYSEETAREIDQEVLGIVDGTYSRVREILQRDRDVLEVLAQRLLEREVIDDSELREIMGLPPRSRHEEENVVAPPAVGPVGGSDEDTVVG